MALAAFSEMFVIMADNASIHRARLPETVPLKAAVPGMSSNVTRAEGPISSLFPPDRRQENTD